MTAHKSIETFEIDGVIEVISLTEPNSTAWTCFAATRRSHLSARDSTSMGASLSYTTRDVHYEWKLYILREL